MIRQSYVQHFLITHQRKATLKELTLVEVFNKNKNLTKRITTTKDRKESNGNQDIDFENAWVETLF